MGLALLEACNAIQNGSQDGHHLGFYSKLEIIKKKTVEILNVSFFVLIFPRKKVKAKNFYSNMTQQHGTYDVSRKHSNQLLPNFAKICQGKCVR